MIFLYSTISSSKSMFGMVAIIRQASALIAPAGHLYRFLDASGLAGCSFPLYCASPRNSSCLVRGLLVCVACRGLCSSACRLLCSSRFFSSSLQNFVFFSLPSYHWVVRCGCVSDSHHLLLGCGSFCASLSPLPLCLWFRLCFFFRVTLW